jgi:hypothetical protein|tara:strand:+ start:535 stop:720 length:186 start_codon:yes stop_codon:yes gene_type:complete
MTDQERKINSLETFVHNANSYALTLERRVTELEKHNRTFLVLNIAGIMCVIFIAAALVLLA